MGRKLALALVAATLIWSEAASAVEMVVTTEVPVDHWKSKYVEQFADAVTKKTGGAVKVKFFPAGQLYTDRDALAALGTGAVHMVWPVIVHLDSLDPRTGLVTLPFTLTDEMMLNPAFAREFNQFLSSIVEKRKVRVLAMLRAADGIIVFKDRQVRKLEDVKGAKVRVTGGKVMLDVMRVLGMNAMSLPASEMTTALTQGAIDGMLTSPAGWRTIIGDVAKQGIYIPGLVIGTYAVVVDATWLEALPAAQNKAVVEAIEEIAKKQWKEGMAEDLAEVKRMVDKGAVFWTAPPAEVRRWKATVQPPLKAFADKYPDTMNGFNAIVKKYEK